MNICTYRHKILGERKRVMGGGSMIRRVLHVYRGTGTGFPRPSIIQNKQRTEVSFKSKL